MKKMSIDELIEYAESEAKEARIEAGGVACQIVSGYGKKMLRINYDECEDLDDYEIFSHYYCCIGRQHAYIDMAHRLIKLRDPIGTKHPFDWSEIMKEANHPSTEKTP